MYNIFIFVLQFIFTTLDDELHRIYDAIDDICDRLMETEKPSTRRMMEAIRDRLIERMQELEEATNPFIPRNTDPTGPIVLHQNQWRLW